MKNNYITLVVVLLLSTTISFAQQTVLLDLGDFGSDTFFAPNNYNNVTDASESGVYNAHVGSHAIADMINDTGASTGFSFGITSDFQYFGGTGNVTAGAFTGAAANFEELAARDYFFTQSDDRAYGEISFSGLDDAKFYTFEIFASRKTTTNRETKYSVIGSTTEIAHLNPGGGAEGNTSNTVIISNIQPTGGVIKIGVENGANNTSNWSYLNCLKMEESVSALSIEDEILAANGVKIYPNPVKESLSISYVLHQDNKTSVNIFDITGRLIFSEKNGSNRAGTYSYTWNRKNNQGGKVATGLYFLEFKIGSKKLTRKIVVE